MLLEVLQLTLLLLLYTVRYIDAYINGVRLIEGQDYTAQDGNIVGLTTHAQSGDVLNL